MSEVHAQPLDPQPGQNVHRVLLEKGCLLARCGEDLLVVEDACSTNAIKVLGIRPHSSFFAPTGGKRWLVLEHANDPSLPISR